MNDINVNDGDPTNKRKSYDQQDNTSLPFKKKLLKIIQDQQPESIDHNPQINYNLQDNLYAKAYSGLIGSDSHDEEI